MKASTFRSIVTRDEADLFSAVLDLLEEQSVPHCVIGGQGVNAYVEPVVSLDVDVVIAVERIDPVTEALGRRFKVERFAHSLNVSDPNSDVRIQIQTDPRYLAFVPTATPREVLGRTMFVARVEDVLQGKVWAATDPTRRPSKRQKDLADISRLIEAYPRLRSLVPASLLERLER